MRFSRLLHGQRTLVSKFINSKGAVEIRISDNQKRMLRMREVLAAMPIDTSCPSRQTKRQLARAAAKELRSSLKRKAVGKRSAVSRDWRTYANA